MGKERNPHYPILTNRREYSIIEQAKLVGKADRT